MYPANASSGGVSGRAPGNRYSPVRDASAAAERNPSITPLGLVQNYPSSRAPAQYLPNSYPQQIYHPSETSFTARHSYPELPDPRAWPATSPWSTDRSSVLGDRTSAQPSVSFPPSVPSSISSHRSSFGPADYYSTYETYMANPSQRTLSGDLPSAQPGPSVQYVATGASNVYSSQAPLPQRRTSGRVEFDGPYQLLARPPNADIEIQESDLIQLPVSLQAQEQDQILTQVNDRLSQCAFDFVAKYQFPIPIEADKRPVRVPADREWTEWCFLLKRLATKRRIPARVLYNGQIKQLVTVLENSLEMRHAAKHQSRPLKDDRNVLQLISAGLQVAKMLKDPAAMRYLDELYAHTERLVDGRRRGGSSH